MPLDRVTCPECHKQLDADLLRCPHCFAWVNDVNPWRRESNLFAIPATIFIAFLVFLTLSYVQASPLEWLQRVLADSISKTIFAFGVYALLLLGAKFRITTRQIITFRLVREHTHNLDRLSTDLVATVRERIQSFNLGSQNLLLAYNRLLWLSEVAKRPRAERERIIRAMQDHAETDWEALDNSFSSTQFLVWLLPSLGFFGTVWGMTGALRGFSEAVNRGSSDLSFQNSLSEIGQQLGVAFHTTLVGLALVIPVIFLATWARRRAQEFLEHLDKFFIRLGAEVIDLPEPPAPSEPLKEPVFVSSEQTSVTQQPAEVAQEPTPATIVQPSTTSDGGVPHATGEVEPAPVEG